MYIRSPLVYLSAPQCHTSRKYEYALAVRSSTHRRQWHIVSQIHTTCSHALTSLSWKRARPASQTEFGTKDVPSWLREENAQREMCRQQAAGSPFPFLLLAAPAHVSTSPVHMCVQGAGLPKIGPCPRRRAAKTARPQVQPTFSSNPLRAS